MTDNTQPPIRLKMKVGNLEFEIECQQDQLEESVQRILSTVTQYAKEPMIIPERPLPAPRAETCKGLIQDLWQEGYFSTPHGLGDVHSEMARRGFHYDRTAVAHALVDLMKEGLLTREGRPRRYRYAQKRPPRT
ncbi:MAG: hypothetical protein NWF03_05295 [Candidatus Bathyarchaeota archaeon]|nr:hypothetical protein [Candidatus Bathyarchaeota archaeon]